MRVFIFLAALLFSVPVWAQSHILTVDLAEDHVDITTGFNGAHLVLYGTKRANGDVVSVIKGPLRDVVVRQKKSVLGAWINRDSLKFEDMPQFYDLATTQDISTLLPSEGLQENGIGAENLPYLTDGEVKDDVQIVFKDALIRNKQRAGLFPEAEKAVQFLNDDFFKVEFYMPSNLPTGPYVVETFLIDNQRVIDKRVTNLRVAQVGFNAGTYQFAQSNAFAYSILIVLVACFAGWLSNAVRIKQ